jgi:hypothetical protein
MSTIEQLAAGSDSDQHCRVAVLGDADSRGIFHVRFLAIRGTHCEPNSIVEV